VKKAEVAIHGNDPLEVAGEGADLPVQPPPEVGFPAQHHHRLGVLAHVHKLVAKVGLAVGLVVVQPHQRPAKHDRAQRAQRSIPHGDHEQQAADSTTAPRRRPAW